MTFRDSEAGSSLLEFSLILPIVVFMFAGIIDFGLAITQGMTVSQAAQVGAQYGTLPGDSANFTGMAAAATAAANGLSGFTVTAANAWSCPPGGLPTSSTAPTCTNAQGTAVKYVVVKTSATINVLFGYTGLPSKFALTGFSAMRVQ